VSASEGQWAQTEANALADKPQSQSSSLDNLLLLLAIIVFVGSCLGIVGIIPVFIIAAGAAQAFISGDIKHVKVTSRFVQIALVVVALLLVGWTVILQLKVGDLYEYHSDTRNTCVILAGLVGSIALIIEFLWVRPFTRQLPVWRAARFRGQSKTTVKTNRIIRRDSLAPYSVADELLKWNKLREDGLISEDEYQEARANLLDRR
jgi:hypothetical protein